MPIADDGNTASEMISPAKDDFPANLNNDGSSAMDESPADNNNSPANDIANSTASDIAPAENSSAAFTPAGDG